MKIIKNSLPKKKDIDNCFDNKINDLLDKKQKFEADKNDLNMNVTYAENIKLLISKVLELNFKLNETDALPYISGCSDMSLYQNGSHYYQDTSYYKVTNNGMKLVLYFEDAFKPNFNTKMINYILRESGISIHFGLIRSEHNNHKLVIRYKRSRQLENNSKQKVIKKRDNYDIH